VELLPLKFDLHVHTCYSHDCRTSLKEVISYSQKKGLDGIAITDHNTVKGALKLIKLKKMGILIIPGIEISTNQGHIIGINVKIPIPSKLSIEETIFRIHKMGGFVIVPHPSALFKGGIGLHKKKFLNDVDAVEVVNSSNFPFSILTHLNKNYANSNGLPQTAGSDSHMSETIGLAYTLIEKTSNLEIEEVIQSIKKGLVTPFGKGKSFRYRIKKIAQGKI
jgi:predicted metal-dependent phosphoesterase TrpH